MGATRMPAAGVGQVVNESVKNGSDFDE